MKPWMFLSIVVHLLGAIQLLRLHLGERWVSGKVNKGKQEEGELSGQNDRIVKYFSNV